MESAIEKTFKAFLREKKALRLFDANFKSLRPERNKEEFFKENKDDPSMFSEGSFTWGDSLEGYDFWSEIHKEWCEFIAKKA